jgi:hypothetical protein
MKQLVRQQTVNNRNDMRIDLKTQFSNLLLDMFLLHQYCSKTNRNSSGDTDGNGHISTDSVLALSNLQKQIWHLFIKYEKSNAD